MDKSTQMNQKWLIS